jgi:glycosyltransferase involved in cell wall biosynthesis
MSTSRLTVSVVIPVYNRAALLRETLETVLAQTWAPDEIFVVDDRSTDGSGDVARAMGARCEVNPRSRGPSGARNHGMLNSRGDIIALLDSDDLWLPTHLETVVGLLTRMPEAGLAFARSRMIGDSTYEMEVPFPPEQPVDAFWACFLSDVLQVGGVAMRKTLVQAVGGFDESMAAAEDWEFWVRCARATPFVFARDVTWHYRRHPEQISKNGILCREMEFRAKARMLAEERAAGNEDRLGRMERLVREAWSLRLREAWSRRDPELMDAFWKLGQFVPDAATVARHWHVRRRLLPFMRHVDRMPAPLRTALKYATGSLPPRT